jgi:hypothetical protein
VPDSFREPPLFFFFIDKNVSKGEIVPMTTLLPCLHCMKFIDRWFYSGDYGPLCERCHTKYDHDVMLELITKDRPN